MTKAEFRAAAYDVLYISKCAVCGVSPDAERLHRMNIADVMTVAKKHMMTSVVAGVLASCGALDGEGDKALKLAKYRSTMQEVYFEKVCGALEDAGISYMPLKGAVTKRFYPSPDMRQMNDIDILIDPAKRDAVRTLMESLGFECKSYYKGIHDIYYASEGVEFEMHVRLFIASAGDGVDSYYDDVASLLPVEGKNLFSTDDLFIYIMAHEYKHYRIAGTGIRQLLDTFVYLKANIDRMDMRYVFSELEKMGIGDYAKKSIALSNSVFSGNDLSESEAERLDEYIFSGVYGNFKNLMEKNLEAAGGNNAKGRAKVIKEKLFLTDNQLKYYYPFFYKHKTARPLLVIYRLGRAATVSRRHVKSQLKTMFGSKDK